MPGEDHVAGALTPCERCGQPTTSRFCAFCRARAQVLGERLGRPPDDREVVREVSEEVMPKEMYAMGSIGIGDRKSE